MSRSIKVGNKAFNVEALAGWKEYENDPQFEGGRGLYVYLSGVNEPFLFQGKEAERLRNWLAPEDISPL